MGYSAYAPVVLPKGRFVPALARPGDRVQHPRSPVLVVSEVTDRGGGVFLIAGRFAGSGYHKTYTVSVTDSVEDWGFMEGESCLE